MQTAPSAAPLSPADTVLARLGTLEARLACDAFEVEAAQALRARAFFAGRFNAPSHDADRFDLYADHLILVDTAHDGPLNERIVGTTRLIQAKSTESFYSQGEFDLAPMLLRNAAENFLEVGRSCVDPSFRGRGGADALWAGIWAYVRSRNISALIGCASLAGTVPAALAPTLSFLAQRHQAAGAFAVRAHAHRFHPTDWMPSEAIDVRAARLGLPPLLRGYLRLGAMIGEGCVVDEEFNATDVFIVLPVGAIGGRYIAQYSASGRAA